MKTKNPHDLFLDQLQDLYSLETQLAASMPGLVTLTTCPELREMLMRHTDQTDQQRARLIGLLSLHGLTPGTDKCKAMEGLIEGGDAHLKAVDEPPTRDLMMIAHCLRIEHYEIAAYGITHRLAEMLGLSTEAAVLKANLEEEMQTARSLRVLECPVFQRAMTPVDAEVLEMGGASPP